jgi:hypothetical protein
MAGARVADGQGGGVTSGSKFSALGGDGARYS